MPFLQMRGDEVLKKVAMRIDIQRPFLRKIRRLLKSNFNIKEEIELVKDDLEVMRLGKC